MSDQIHFQPATAGYGARVFVSVLAPAEVHEFFRAQSIWGGCDKSGENFLSYELSNDHNWLEY